MKTVQIVKAGAVRGPAPPDTTIVISGEPPAKNLYNITLKEVERYWDEQAETLCDALFASLPQGTMDCLLYKIMRRKVSLYQGLCD
jgi:hypothetical protein